MSVVEFNRIKKVAFTNTGIDASVVQHKIQVYPNEQVKLSVFGIMKNGSSSFSILGVGKSYNPENTLVVTDKRLLFIQIPVSGGNAVVD